MARLTAEFSGSGGPGARNLESKFACWQRPHPPRRRSRCPLQRQLGDEPDDLAELGGKTAVYQRRLDEQPAGKMLTPLELPFVECLLPAKSVNLTLRLVRGARVKPYRQNALRFTPDRP